MDALLKIVKSGSVDAVKEVVSCTGIPSDCSWIDYLCLNQAIIDQHDDIATYLIEHNCRVENTQANVMPHDTPLHSAVRRRSANLVTKLLEKRASVTILNHQGYSPLHLAFELRHEVIVDLILRFIVKTSCYFNIKMKNGLSHFHVACTRKNVEAIKGFIMSKVDIDEAIDVNSDYRPGYTAKHFAAEFQSLEAVRVLTDATSRGPSLARDKIGQSPVDLARKSLEELSIMVYLLSGESQPKIISNDLHMSQFHIACTQANPRLVQKFIENGVAVNNLVADDATFCPGYSPLHCAVESNCRESVELLLKENACVDRTDANFATPLHLAMYLENPEEKDTIVDLLYKTLSDEDKLASTTDVFGLNYFHLAISRNELDLVKDLLDSGEEIDHRVLYNSRQFSCYSPLHTAVRYRHFEMAKLLIERGADVREPSKDGTPLHIAIEVGQTDIVDLLLEHNPNVNVARMLDGKTMLHSLVERYMKNREKIDNKEEVNVNMNGRLLLYIERLVYLGCDVNHRDDNGNTALHIACEKIFYGINCVRSLLNCGADINIENYYGDTPFNCAFHDVYRNNPDAYMLLYHHVQKLKVLGLLVNVKNESCCQKILDESRQCDPKALCFKLVSLDIMKHRRRDEVMAMKAIKLTKAMSLYNFVRLDKLDVVTSCITNDVLKKIMTHDEVLDQKFPIYGYLIRLQFARGARYLQLISKKAHSAKRKRSE